MDSADRIKQLIENNVPVYRGSRILGYLAKEERKNGLTPPCELLGVFPDGSKEVAYWIEPYSDFGKMGPLVRWGYVSSKKALREILNQEGVLLPEKSSIRVDLHVLEASDGQVYEFMLPSRKYLRRK